MSSGSRGRAIVSAGRGVEQGQPHMDNRKNSFLKLETPAGRTVTVMTQTHPRARRMSLTVGLQGPKLSTPRGNTPKLFVKQTWWRGSIRIESMFCSRTPKRRLPPKR